MEGRVFENFQKKYFQNSKKSQKCSQIIQTCFEHVLGKIFEKIYAQCSMEGRVFENFPKNQKNSQNSKMPKSVPKTIQTCFERVLGQTFRKIFAQFSMECRVFENFQKKIFSKFQKYPKVFPKVSKRVLG